MNCNLFNRILNCIPDYSYEQTIVTTTITGVIVGCTVGMDGFTKNNDLLYVIEDSVTGGLFFGLVGFGLGVFSPFVIPVFIMGGTIGGIKHGLKFIKEM